LAGFWDFTWFVFDGHLRFVHPEYSASLCRRGRRSGWDTPGDGGSVGLTNPIVDGLVLGQFLFAVSIHVALGAAFAVFAARPMRC